MAGLTVPGREVVGYAQEPGSGGSHAGGETCRDSGAKILSDYSTLEKFAYCTPVVRGPTSTMRRQRSPQFLTLAPTWKLSTIAVPRIVVTAEVEALNHSTLAVEAEQLSKVHIRVDQGEEEAHPIDHPVPAPREVQLHASLLRQHKAHDRGVTADDHASGPRSGLPPL